MTAPKVGGDGGTGLRRSASGLVFLAGAGVYALLLGPLDVGFELTPLLVGLVAVAAGLSSPRRRALATGMVLTGWGAAVLAVSADAISPDRTTRPTCWVSAVACWPLHWSPTAANAASWSRARPSRVHRPLGPDALLRRGSAEAVAGVGAHPRCTGGLGAVLGPSARIAPLTTLTCLFRSGGAMTGRGRAWRVREIRRPGARWDVRRAPGRPPCASTRRWPWPPHAADPWPPRW